MKKSIELKKDVIKRRGEEVRVDERVDDEVIRDEDVEVIGQDVVMRNEKER
ncbi:hypothetical protein [Bacillus altitudinis]|uniref:hypothetical protein n=1 Tax=Bacillus altitudinis TaxID=293387 RepID=UPI0016437CDE|nr:hypothetical protein [Bacillus altitudinis]